jgi:hypothetical protein
MIMARFQILLVATLIFLAACSPSGSPGSSQSALPDSNEALQVSPDALRGHIEFLASDSLRGRDTGSRGHRVAADYVAAEFTKLGLKAAGDEGSYFQRVPMIEQKLGQGSATAVLHSAGGDVVLEYPRQFMMGPDRINASREVTAAMVFVGYGIVAEEFGHNDYEGLDVEGKIVVSISGRPQSWPTEEGAHLGGGREKARQAVERGAVGRVILHTPREEETFPYDDELKYIDVPGMDWVGPDGMPDGHWPQLLGGAFLNLDAAALLFEGSPVPLEDIYAADRADEEIPHFELPTSITLARESSHRLFDSPNVVAILEGSDPELKNEFLVYSAHLDHLGVIKNEEGIEEIYNGAMDNAAGIATLLETARVLSAEKHKLKRSVLFIAVTGEEKGLLGSGYFASNPTVPIESLVANINLDMPLILYQFADVIAFGAEHSSLKASVAKAAKRAGVELAPDPIPEQGLFTRSDHYRFVQQGVPSVFLVTGFTDRNPDNEFGQVFQNFIKQHYHQPSDNIELDIDYEGGALFAEINVNIGREICNDPQRPTWNEGDFFGDTFAGED